MGIYIKGTEMPKEHPLYITLRPDGSVYVWDSYSEGYETQAILVPEHGRLGDLDALATIHRKGADKGDSAWKFHVTAKAWVNEMPTIIPADPPRKEQK